MPGFKGGYAPSVDKASHPALDVVFVHVKVNCMKVSDGRTNVRQLQTAHCC